MRAAVSFTNSKERQHDGSPTQPRPRPTDSPRLAAATDKEEMIFATPEKTGKKP